ncbi:MAG: efflux RND transporter permease subunit [Leptospiraceae bacterium]|nr:efflux RND transporter permease subunit [Leptospiraceae bacterium]MCP5513254.1 efflux RND transporter permease subunit [Leptospiraceae bacterium]
MKFLAYIVNLSLRNRVIVILFTFFFAIYGLFNTYNLSMDAVPDVTTIQVQIITSAPSLSPVEIEQYITFPVERSMTGIPRVEEIRSISRYGLSVITIVFFDGTDIYWARQMINERLSDAANAIPSGYGKPFIGPISTGLGEIYQFTLRSNRHSVMELTTLLNWYINPLLKTVPGVVEVNTFGGETKQFHIKVNVNRMQALGFSLKDVLGALEKNNASMGGGYIEKNKEHYLIASNGLYADLDEIKKTVVGEMSSIQDTNRTPVTIEMIAEVSIGHRLRLGAVSQNGNGEVVGAMALMLMQENSLRVTEGIKAKLEELKPFLPEGVEVIPFYDRTMMVKKTIQTVLINLIEGAVLVIVILFLLIGNLRAGLIIAITIPLAMLFAITMMKLRGFPGNLMSMGAVDFGLVVDGAVIIVENSVRHIAMAEKKFGRILTEPEKVKVVEESTLEVRKATIFGELIISIVYLPILTMSGVEGKMFIPMATTVIFALMGAFVLSLTIVPVLASVFLESKMKEEKHTPIFGFISRYYEPLLAKFMGRRERVMGSTIALFLFSMFLFLRMGGEFLPELDEGSMLLEIARLPSISLTESIETSSRLEKALLKEIPEIIRAVSKTGAPDIATDPMGIERTDMYLVMKDKSEWEHSREDVIRKIEEVSEESVPEVAISVSQPIKMRTNELIAGIRSDIGVKIFGDDLDQLRQIGEHSATLLKNIPGVKDIKIEQLSGLNYIKIKPDRSSLSRYNIDIEDINILTQSLSAGVPAGYVYEGFKKFEISLKLGDTNIYDNSSLTLLPVRSKSGLVPLGDVSSITWEKGPVQVSHENGQRRMLVEFNVRDRDLLGVVEEVQSTLLAKLKLPDGYRIEFGGKYENYLSARTTLSIVVPITLMLILSLLFVAFGELSPALIIFLNIPFSVIGGIIFLFLRGIPFSISAGVGFIALFGVSVLNGLVLITFAKDLELEGRDFHSAIIEAAHLRLRPVLTTAIVAAIGFLPMALSRSMGAEVQRPLATVVIGGLISSSILTLLVIPVVYDLYFEYKKSGGRTETNTKELGDNESIGRS